MYSLDIHWHLLALKKTNISGGYMLQWQSNTNLHPGLAVTVLSSLTAAGVTGFALAHTSRGTLAAARWTAGAATWETEDGDKVCESVSQQVFMAVWILLNT